MASFKLHSNQLHYKLSRHQLFPNKSTTTATASSAKNHHRRQQSTFDLGRLAMAHLLHREKQVYSVVPNCNGTPVTVEEKHHLLAQRLVPLDDSDHHRHSDLIRTALSDIHAPINCNFDSVIDHILAVLHQDQDHDDDDHVIITVELLSLRIYRCFEEVADSDFRTQTK